MYSYAIFNVLFKNKTIFYITLKLFPWWLVELEYLFASCCILFSLFGLANRGTENVMFTLKEKMNFWIAPSIEFKWICMIFRIKIPNFKEFPPEIKEIWLFEDDGPYHEKSTFLDFEAKMANSANRYIIN